MVLRVWLLAITTDRCAFAGIESRLLEITMIFNPEMIAAARVAASQVSQDTPTVSLPSPWDGWIAVSSRADAFDGPAMTTITVDGVTFYIGTVP